VAIEDFIFVTQATEEVRQRTLEIADAADLKPLIECHDMIHATDWTYENSDVKKPYAEEMFGLLRPAFDEFALFIDCKELQLSTHWFQRYDKLGNHDWHVHSNTMFGMVFFAELPEGAPPTELRWKGIPYTPDVKQGDVLFFPSFLYHRSPENQSDGRKTVFVTNINFS